jgi:glycine/D-amino acid oxidase-like deaminating enzyme
MRIAILGGGFAGLAVTWYILHYSQGSYTIDLFDPAPVAGGASGLSSGLLHIYTGKQARLAWEGPKCLRETHRLITVASQAISKPIVISKGILRPAVSAQQIADFQTCAQTYSDTEWWDKKQCENKVSGLHLPADGGGLYIKEGLTLDVRSYLQGLWQACAFHGSQFHQQAMVTPQDLAGYDRILIAMGPLTKNFPPLKDLPIAPVKGQILELKWPDGVEPLPFSLNSQKYVVMRPDLKSCLVGSTYEHQFMTPKPEKEKALEEIMPNILEFFPALKDAKVIAVRAAFRASTPSHLPMVGKISDKFYFFTGLGSKGLLYHAWVGKHMARAMLTTHTKHFPEAIYYPVPQMEI